MMIWTTLLFCLMVVNGQVTNEKTSGLSHLQIIKYLTKGHIILRNVMPEMRDPEFIVELESAKLASEKEFQKYALERHGCPELISRVDDGDGKSALKLCAKLKDGELDQVFYQLVQLHTHSDYIRRVATGEKFASIASDLLQKEQVRLYQTGTFRKIPSEDPEEVELFNQPTSMHTDLNQVPVDTNAYLTFWCPTRNLTARDSVLTYASESHTDTSKAHWYTGGDAEEPEVGRLFSGEPSRPKLPEGQDPEVDRITEEMMETAYDPDAAGRYRIEIYDDIRVGDCVAHHGWLYHACTSQSKEGGPRESMTFSYIDANARKLMSHQRRGGSNFFEEDGSSEDETSFNQWYHEVEEGTVIDHPKLIVVWPPAAAKASAEAAKTWVPPVIKPKPPAQESMEEEEEGDEELEIIYEYEDEDSEPAEEMSAACKKVETKTGTLFDQVQCNLEKAKKLKADLADAKKEL